MPIVDNVEDLLQQLHGRKGTESSNSNTAQTEIIAAYTSAKQTITEMENEIQQLKQTISMNEDKDAKNKEENKKHIDNLQSKLFSVIQEKNILEKRNSEMLSDINDANSFKVKYDQSQKENAILKTQMEEFAARIKRIEEDDLRSDKIELRQLKEKNDFLSKTVLELKPLEEKNQVLAQSVLKLKAENLKLVQDLSKKTLAFDTLIQSSKVSLTGVDGTFSSTTQTIFRIEKEVENIKSTASTYEQTIKLLKLKDLLNKVNGEVDEMEAGLKRRIQQFDDEFKQKCNNFKGTSVGNCGKVEVS